jgi:phosphoribosylglycinamide formyltransferase-1
MTTPRKRAVVFISGGGSNMMALVAAAKAGDYPAEIVGVISDKAGCRRACQGGSRGHRDLCLCPQGLCQQGSPRRGDLCGTRRAFAGYSLPCRLYAAAQRHVHPALRGKDDQHPPFAAALFPGLHTHQRAIDAGMRIAGCTVHFVTEGMDEGPVIGQAAVPVLSGDTADTLAGRVLSVEHQIYPQALRLFAEGKVAMEDGKAVRAAGTSTEAELAL